MALAFMHLYNIFNFQLLLSFTKTYDIETQDRNGKWYQHLLSLFAMFTRAIPKGTFGLCLYVYRLSNVHALCFACFVFVRDLNV